MDKELFDYFTTDNISGKKCTEKWLSKNNFKLYSCIISWCNENHLENLEFKRMVFHYITDNNKIPVCLNCGGEVKYKRINYGYQPYCSPVCQNSCAINKDKWLRSWKSGNSNNEYITTRNKTILEKYGNVENYNKQIQYNTRKTCLEKYGVEYVMQTDFYKKKMRKTCLEKYGSETYNNPDKCRSTKINNRTQISDDNISELKYYRKIAINRTITMYRNNSNIINPHNLKRGHKLYHIDHKFSVKRGYLLGLPVEIITHPANLEMLYYRDNMVKSDKCSITIQDLLNSIVNFNEALCFSSSEISKKYEHIREISSMLLENYKI